ncbi:MAG: hypothetical protein R3F56_03205 [Planctomycetota bacterium]
MTGAVALWCATLAAAAAGLFPRRRLPTVVLLAAAAFFAVQAIAEGGAQRRLEVVHEQAAYVGNQVEQKRFLVEVTRAPAWQWAAAAAAFCLFLAAAARTRLAAANPFAWPVLLAWSGIALALLLEKLAAPPEVGAYRLHGTVWLAAVAGAVLLARTRPTVAAFAATFLLLAIALWAPAGILATLATTRELGTSLDVHGIEFCAHPLGRTPLSLEPGSTQQLWYLVWTPLLVLFPLLTWLSAGGVGFLQLMLQREAAARASAPR